MTKQGTFSADFEAGPTGFSIETLNPD